MNALTNVTYFLIDTLFSLYIAIVMIRLLLGLARADFYNPFSQFIVTATNPLIVPLRRLLPPVGKVDTAALVILVILKLIQVSLLLLLKDQAPAFLPIIGHVIKELLSLAVYIYIFAIIIQAVMSWVNPSASIGGNPMVALLSSLTRPIVEPLSRIIPKMGMIDLSPLAALLLLQIVLIIIGSF